MLKESVVLLKKIWQVDNHHFSIEWTDSRISKYRLSTLQQHCPCAGCVEARNQGTLAVDDDVTAVRVSSVGRYALRIQFRRGCSAGIFDYSLLRSLDKELECESFN